MMTLTQEDIDRIEQLLLIGSGKININCPLTMRSYVLQITPNPPKYEEDLNGL